MYEYEDEVRVSCEVCDFVGEIEKSRQVAPDLHQLVAFPNVGNVACPAKSSEVTAHIRKNHAQYT